MWMVMSLEKKVTVEFMDIDGMVGMVPVFETQADAEAFSDGRFVLQEIGVVEEQGGKIHEIW